MAVEGFKDGFEKTVRHQHASGHYIDDRDALLGCDCLESIAATRCPSRDLCAFARCIARVQYVHRNVLLNCWQHGGGVQHSGSEIGKLVCVVETDHLNDPALVSTIRIGS